MRKLGLDLGNKTLGIALSDDLGFLANGIDTFRFADKDFKSALEFTLNLLTQYNIDVIVLGYPKNMDGTLGEQALYSQEFKEEILRNNDTIKVVLWDERLTSRMASNMMKSQNLSRKKRANDIDKMAAVIILQSYLDSQR